MKFLNYLKRKYSKTREPQLMTLQDAAVNSFRDRIYQYPRVYFLRKGPKRISTSVKIENKDLPFPDYHVKVTGWIQRGI